MSRPAAAFPTSVWGDASTPFASAHLAHVEDVTLLKETVRSMITDVGVKQNDKMNLIDTLNRLGLSYHFESEIDDQLKQFFECHSLEDYNEHDLHTTALHFRVFRQHGYKMSCDVFKKFKDMKTGNFEESLGGDGRGLLSLYEAAHLRISGEDILDEALAFATSRLGSTVNELTPHLQKQVIQALNRPFNRGTPRIEARLYISIYEEDESRNDMLLKLAKLDFNNVQLMLRQELSEMAKWWKDLGLASKLPYARLRVAEGYFWTVGAYFEPRYARARTILGKVFMMISTLDDTYDAYGTIEELHLLTDAINRWDISALDQLPDYMKPLYRALLELYDEFDVEMSKEGRSYSVQQAKEGMKETAIAYTQEAKWFNEGKIPSFEEYMKIGLLTAGYHMLTRAAFVGMGEIANQDAYNWLESRPTMTTASEIICRLANDMKSHEFEQRRGHVASAVECYMTEHGCSREVMAREFQERIDTAWKDLNEACLMPTTAVSRHLTQRILNLSRMIEVIYKYADGYTHTEFLEDYINTMFFSPVPL